MSLLCAEGSETIIEETVFSSVYFLGTAIKLRFPEKEGEDPYWAPNVCVCARHLDAIPADLIKQDPNNIEGLVYGIVRGYGIPKIDGPWKGAIRLDGVMSDTRKYVYVDEATFQRSVPKAFERLNEERLRNEFPDEDLGLKAYRVVYDRETGIPLFMIMDRPLEDRSKYNIEVYVDGERQHGIKFVSIDHVREKVLANKFGVHDNKTSHAMFMEDYKKAMKGFAKAFGLQEIEEKHN